ncbi:MAG: methionyl aminopeptidase [Clostridium sp.]
MQQKDLHMQEMLCKFRCGSRLKYKKCHLDFDKKLETLKKQGCVVPTRNLIKSKEQIDGIRKSAEINKLAHEFTITHGGILATLNVEDTNI